MTSILADQGATCPPYHLCKEDILQTVLSPSHIIAELIFSIVFDLVLIFLVWGKLIKPYVKRKLDQAHQELDAEHGVDHHLQNQENE
jgi:hypothetical protein